MKKMLLLLVLFISQFVFSQNSLTMKSGGSVFDGNNQKIDPDTMRDFLKDSPDALKLYNAGRSKKTTGNILLWSGITMLVGKYISDVSGDKVEVNQNSNDVQFKSTTNTLYFVAGALIVVSIPIKIGFEKKIKKSVDLINQSNSKETTLYLNSEIVANSNGIGFKITF